MLKKVIDAPKFEGGEEKKEGEVQDGAKYEKMPIGDYMVHVHVQFTKNLKIGEDTTGDPYVSVEMLNQSKQTQCKKDATLVNLNKFDEHLFLNFNSLTKEQVREAKINICVINKGFFKGDVIGSFELSMSKIYSEKNHLMEH